MSEIKILNSDMLRKIADEFNYLANCFDSGLIEYSSGCFVVDKTDEDTVIIKSDLTLKENTKH